MYQIIIKKIEVEEVEKKEYEKISDTGGNDDGAKYGYVSVKRMEKIEQIILQQEIDAIDLEAIIKAVNQIK